MSRRPRPRSTSARLALAVTASFLLAFVLLGGGVYLAVSALLRQDARELVRTDAAGLLELYRGEGRGALRDELRRRIAAPEDPDAVYAWVAPDGRAVLGAAPPWPRRPAAHRLAPRWIEYVEDPGAGRPRVIARLQPLDDGSVLLAGLRLRSQDRFLALMLRTALAALLAAATLGALIGWLTSRGVSRRLRSLDATAARVGAGELGLRAPLDGSDDAFDRLARRFNGMLDRIEDLLGGVRHATDHIAHDLRTPLTRLRNRLEELRRQPAEARGAALDAALAETDQLLQAFGALLRLARIEAQPPVQDEPVLALEALVADAVELYTPSAGERGLRLRARLLPCRVRGDRDQLFQLVVNLLDNALKYAPAGSEVEVSLQPDEEGALLQVDDRGPGIPEADRERVFDRFQRLEAHRGSPGIGLGLSLVRAILQRHGGRIRLLDRAPGLRVRVLLPPA
ncbi:sensor histidine kinase [Vulcaniibacterium tengchongense]|uniref:histidine kinase n=1 Tax=Vulcaniibacterium tengchongense TaxID=1273429 RepID=A0A3N4VCT5_9GAMM|nr:HAMP domain-containing sensor histidine kinase [Vulcaniibacterium tengchongense]RPE79623.1 signal transduction histidine kinase [Vulcaniibacterium tengchongense]